MTKGGGVLGERDIDIVGQAMYLWSLYVIPLF